MCFKAHGRKCVELIKVSFSFAIKNKQNQIIIFNTFCSGIDSPELVDVQLKECNMLGGYSMKGIDR